MLLSSLQVLCLLLNSKPMPRCPTVTFSILFLVPFVFTACGPCVSVQALVLVAGGHEYSLLSVYDGASVKGKAFTLLSSVVVPVAPKIAAVLHFTPSVSIISVLLWQVGISHASWRCSLSCFLWAGCCGHCFCGHLILVKTLLFGCHHLLFFFSFLV